VRALLAVIDSKCDTSKLDSVGLRKAAAKAGIFIGDHTLEVDLFRGGWHELLASALSESELTTNGRPGSAPANGRRSHGACR
jgi:hypothetical protein